MKRIWNPLDQSQLEEMRKLLPSDAVIIAPDPSVYLYKGASIVGLLFDWYSKNFPELNEAEAYMTSTLAAGYLEHPIIYSNETPSLMALANLHKEDMTLWDIWAHNKLSRPQMEYPILCIEVITGNHPKTLDRLLKEADDIEKSKKISTFEKGQGKALVAKRMDTELRKIILEIIDPK
jgi:hypothetical protein